MTRICSVIDLEYAKEVCRMHTNVCGPRKTGKTHFLRQIKKCIEEDTRERIPVIYLDFSDYHITTFEESLGYFRVKMSALYLSLWNSCTGETRYYKVCEKYLNAIEGKHNEAELAESLLNLIRILKSVVFYATGNTYVRPIVLIDEIGKPLLFAAKYGFSEKMRAFYDAFLDIDHYELTLGMCTTSFAPLNMDIQYNLPYLKDIPINECWPISEYCKDIGVALEVSRRRCEGWHEIRYFEQSVTMLEAYQKLQTQYAGNGSVACATNIQLTADVSFLVNEKRHWIETERKKEAKTKRLKKAKEKAEYAAPYPEGCYLPSKYAGIRQLEMFLNDTAKYDELNYLLKVLYEEYGRNATRTQIYRFLQDIKKKQSYLFDMGKLLTGLKTIAEGHVIDHCSVRLDDYWGRFDLQRRATEANHNDLALVKVYLSVLDENAISNTFADVVGFLINNGVHRFHAKISQVYRRDHMCFWISREDFFRLEQFLDTYEIELVTSLPFIAYRGKMGITRELCTFDSHNGIQASLISTYLHGIHSQDEIDVLDMYQKYVKAWNGDADGRSSFSRAFKQRNAQEFVILLETLDVLLGNATITDDHILLNGDSELWHNLGWSRNWYEFGGVQKQKKCPGI